MPEPARQQGGEEMERASPQRAGIALPMETGCKINGLTQGDTASWTRLTLGMWSSPLLELDSYLDLPLPWQKSPSKTMGRIQGFKEYVQPARLLLCWILCLV